MLALSAARLVATFTGHGITSEQADVAARAYRVERARYGASSAVKRARLALLSDAPAAWPRERPSIGAADKGGARWIVDPAAYGLRFVGWSDERASRRIDHRGWYLRDSDFGEVARGCVYALPAREGRSRLVAGFRCGSTDKRGNWSDEATGETESACVDLSTIYLGEPGEDHTDMDSQALRDACSLGDSMAERYAEREREYQENWNSGQDAARAIEQAKELRERARGLLIELRGARGELPPMIEAQTRGEVARLLTEARERYDSARSLWGQYGHDDAFREGAGAATYAESVK